VPGFAVHSLRFPALILVTLVLTIGLAARSGSAAPDKTIELAVLGTYHSGIFAEGGAEIVKYDEKTQRVFSVNAFAAAVDVLDVTDPTQPELFETIDVAATLAAASGFTGVVAGANSVAVDKGVLAVAVEADPKTDTGWVAFYHSGTLQLINWVEAGALPDMVVFTPNGQHVLVANEGEPNSYGEDDSVDPVGSVSIIDVSAVAKGNGNAKPSVVTAGFDSFNGQEDDLRAAGVRIFGPGADASMDFEPEYIAVAPDGRSAYVTLQENNAVAVLDLKTKTFTKVLPLGFKDHSLSANKFDGSDEDGEDDDGEINIENWPVFGMYMPDGIAAYKSKGKDYFVTANEGDSRDDWFEEDARVEDLILDSDAFPDADDLQNANFIGRLTVTNTLGDTEGDDDFDELYAFGARSFSIWDADGNLVFDSGDAFEQITADLYGDDFFNSDHEEANFDNRSDNKGPEPEGVAIGEINGRTYAFIGLERIGGIMVYDITSPTAPVFVQYLNNRDFTADPESEAAGDLGPEGIDFIPAKDSPIGKPMLAVGNEVSGTTTLYVINVQ